MTQAVQNLSVDGVEYPFTKFSAEVQNLLALRGQWANELGEERSKVIKTEAALRQLDGELTEMVQKEIAEFPTEAPAAKKPRAKKAAAK